VKWILERASLHRNDQGEPVLIEGAIQDITDLKEKEEEVRISNERFQIAMKATNEMIWDWDVSSDVVVRSQGYYTIFGYDTDEMTSVQDFWLKHIHADDRERVIKSLNDTLNDPEEDFWKVEYRFIKANDEIAHVTDRGYVIRDREGKAQRVVGSVLDITQNRQLMNNIRKQNEQLRNIAWAQSHEVRAPLARLMSLVHILETIEAGSAVEIDLTREEILDNIRSSADELDQIIRIITHKTDQMNM
jgi:PAS domain S-box-containing protein